MKICRSTKFEFSIKILTNTRLLGAYGNSKLNEMVIINPELIIIKDIIHSYSIYVSL